MIHEFEVLTENPHTEEKLWSAFSVDMSAISCCWSYIEDPNSTCVSIKGSDFVLRIRYNDFVSIWRTCVEDLNISNL